MNLFPNATIIDAISAMNKLGNVSFCQKFPDFYNSMKKDLKTLYQPYFEILDDEPNSRLFTWTGAYKIKIRTHAYWVNLSC